MGGIKRFTLHIWHLQCFQKVHINNVLIVFCKCCCVLSNYYINLFLLKSYYKVHTFRVWNVLVSFLYFIIWYDFAAWSLPFLILLSGDIVTNPCTKNISGQSFPIYHWNLNSISAHNFIKIFLLTANVLVHNFDIICLSETYLNSTLTRNMNRWQKLRKICLLLVTHWPS